MKEENKRKLLIVVIMIIAVLSIISARDRRIRKQTEKEKDKIIEKNDDNMNGFNLNIIKKIHELDKDKNYLLSPYNIEIALNMLREGANGNTKDEITKIIGNRHINDIRLTNKIGVANGVFIKDIYQNEVKNNFYHVLKNNYQADIIYDEYKTPKVINDWVNEKTNGMINNVINNIDKDFVMGLASALAIDVEWLSKFECNNTFQEEFTKLTGDKLNVEMMHKTYKSDNYKYLTNDDGEGIIIPYQKEENSNIELEFIGFIPKNGIDKYIDNLTDEKLKKLTDNYEVASDKLRINLSLPRFKYSYEVSDFKKALINLGIKEIFDDSLADFSNIIDKNRINGNLSVSDAIHKTFIDLSETGTKAAAVTYFGLKANGAFMEEDYQEINIEFNKPFIYMIREKNTNELLFFGTVYEPNKWEKTTCND